jgi:hypothetical protein
MLLPRPLARAKNAERGALFDVNGFHLQVVNVGAIVVLSVGDGGLNHLLDDSSSFFCVKFRMLSA